MKRILVESARHLAMTPLLPLEAMLRSRVGAEGTQDPVVFVIGPPRSGTTLLYEWLVSSFHFSYFSNLAHRFYNSPLAVSWLFRGHISNWRGSYSSRLGHIAGWGSPNEGGWLWNQYLPPDVDSLGSLSAKQVLRLRALVYGTRSIFAQPFLNKNVMHSCRIDLLSELFPGCVFIEVRRSVADNIRSIVRARRSHPTSERWWSVMPRAAKDYLDADHITQAYVQVTEVQREIEASIAGLGQDRRIVVDYDDFCQNSGSYISAVSSFLLNHGLILEPREGAQQQFTARSGALLDPESEKSINILVEGSASVS